MIEDQISTENGKTILRCQYDSLDEFVDAVERRCPEDERDRFDHYKEFYGVNRHQDAYKLARDGWSEHLNVTLDVVESAVEKVETEHEMTTFQAKFDVSGGNVDVARYLSGEPECMVEFELKPIVKAGRVITLCAGTSFSASISTEAIIRRGQVIAALALALSRLGYATEIWSDHTSSWTSPRTNMVQTRVRVKSATEPLDAERILYAFAHPSMCRVLTFQSWHGLPRDWRDPMGVNGFYGIPVNEPIRDLPEGTVYIRNVQSAYDIPDLDQEVISYLQELEILPKD